MRLSLQARPPFDLALTACVLRRVPQNPIYEAALAEPGATYRTVARRFQVTRQEICQYMALVKRLPTAVLSAVEAERDPLRLRRFSLRHLLAIARLGRFGEARRVRDPSRSR